jgi:hypothetical protein
MPGGDDTLPPYILISDHILSLAAEGYIGAPATIIDFHALEPSICRKTCSLLDVIYGAGPSMIMSDEGFRTMASSRAAVQALKGKQGKVDTAQRLPIPGLLRRAQRTKRRQLRWFHIPYNDVSYIRAVSVYSKY